MSRSQRLGPRDVCARDRDPEPAVGAGQPFAGAIADRYGGAGARGRRGPLRGGRGADGVSTTPRMLNLTRRPADRARPRRGSFTIVIAALRQAAAGAALLAIGVGTAAGCFGQFLFAPLAVGADPQRRLEGDAGGLRRVVLPVMPLSFAVATPRDGHGPAGCARSRSRAARRSREAFGHRSYVLLVLGFFACGFHVAFITVHLPPYLGDRGLDGVVGGWTIAIIGLVNIVGSIAAGVLGGRYTKR